MACLKARKGFEIDLFSLFLLVKRYGGYEQVSPLPLPLGGRELAWQIVDDAVWVEIARSLDESLQVDNIFDPIESPSPCSDKSVQVHSSVAKPLRQIYLQVRRTAASSG